MLGCSRSRFSNHLIQYEILHWPGLRDLICLGCNFHLVLPFRQLGDAVEEPASAAKEVMDPLQRISCFKGIHEYHRKRAFKIISHSQSVCTTNHNHNKKDILGSMYIVTISYKFKFKFRFKVFAVIVRFITHLSSSSSSSRSVP